MNEAGRFQKVRELFDATAELPADQRLANLRRLTDDESVVQEVLAMCVANDSDSTGQFSKPLSSILQSAAAPTLKAGDTLGVWQIGREIGHGGMGSVYLVERVDGHFTQTAALKFVRGLPRAETLNYFSRERQLLAKLSHPNIARLLDGGAAPSGQPYLVMEYVDGVAIDVYCRERRLSAEQVLKLFVEACDSVAFAHRQLIVHCDLKPSNLLINQDGRPMLLDFGIARLLDRVGAQANDAAIGSSVAYTPRYASPEQREHGVVSTVSDIFSLGIMLAELLGGAATTNAELKAILAKASAIDPAKRYATVDAFAEDIQRYLRKLPIAAMPPTAAYTAQKFMQRRWPLVLAGAAFAATVLGFTAKVIVEAERATKAEKTALRERDRAQLAEGQAVTERDHAAQERDRATVAESAAATERNSARRAEALAIRERDRATLSEKASAQTRDFLVSVFKASNPNAKTGEVTASTLVAEAEARVEREMDGQPMLQADLYLTLADVQKNLGNLQLARVTYRKAIALARNQDRPLYLAQMVRRLAILDMSAFGGTEALELGRESLALSEKYANAESEDIAHSLSVIGYATFSPKAAQAFYLRALAIREKLDPQSEGTENLLVMLGHNARDLNQGAAALTYYQRSLSINERRLGPLHPVSMTITDGMAKAQLDLGMTVAAEANIRRNIKISEKLHGADSATTARQIVSLASLLATTGRSRDALDQYQAASAVFEKQLGQESSLYTLARCQMAQVLADLGNKREAVSVARASLALAQRVWTPTHPAMAIVMRVVGRVLMDNGEYAAALPLLRSVLSIYQQINEANHPNVLLSRTDLGVCYAALGDVDNASAQLDAAALQFPANDVRVRADYERGRALVATSKGDIDTALQAYMRHEQLNTQLFGPQDARAWLAKIPRAELLAARSAGSDRQQSRLLADQILAAVSSVLVADAPVLNRLRALQTP